uniref:Uncharacterized protein n=1 Tax=Arundo donax TaxID=35708 RepID=A0A0A9A3T2_ARUDO
MLSIRAINLVGKSCLTKPSKSYN